MFGYIKPYTPELKVRENEFFGAVYCGLCRCMGKCTGSLSKATLSYDYTFLCLLVMALSHECGAYTIKSERCPAHPMKKRTVLVPANEKKGGETARADLLPTEKCAYLSALLAYYKLRDDIADTRGIKRLGRRLCLPYFSHMRGRALKASSETFDASALDKSICGSLDALRAKETAKSESADENADIFGALLSAVFAGCLPGGDEKRIASDVGFHAGRWIYLLDAADDLAEDKKSGAYNPYLFSLCKDGVIGQNERGMICDALLLELEKIKLDVDLVDFSDCRAIESIIDNIVLLGMPDAAEKVMRRGEKAENTAKS